MRLIDYFSWNKLKEHHKYIYFSFCYGFIAFPIIWYVVRHIIIGSVLNKMYGVVIDRGNGIPSWIFYSQEELFSFCNAYSRFEYFRIMGMVIMLLLIIMMLLLIAKMYLRVKKDERNK